MPAKKKAAKPVPRKQAVKKAKPAPKKAVKKPAAKPLKKKTVHKPVPKKPVNKKTNSSSKTVKKIVKKATKPVSKKAAPSKPAPKKAIVKKAVAKSVPKAKTESVSKAKVASKSVPQSKPASKKTEKPVNKQASVQAKPQPKPVVKKEVVAKPPVTAVKAKTETTKVAAPSTSLAKPSVQAAVKNLKKEAKKPSRPENFKPPVTTVSTIKTYKPDFVKSVLDKGQSEPQSKTLVRYSDADLAEFKELIVKKLDAAKKELVYLQGLITHKDEGNGDDGDGRYMTMENGSESMEREQLSQMASRQITYIDHLEKALMRVENKTYGVCRVTGKLIDKARLKAVPHATLSMEAKLGQHKLTPTQGE